MLTLTAARLDVPTVEVGALPPASPPAEMLISALPTGTYETPAIFAFRGGSSHDTRHFASTAVLVHHPKRNVLNAIDDAHDSPPTHHAWHSGRGVEFRDFFRCKREARRGHVLFQMCDAYCTWDGQDDRASPQEPIS